MLDVLVFLGAGLTLTLILSLLHRLRKRESLVSADLSSPLPPLKLDIGTSQLVDPEKDILGVSSWSLQPSVHSGSGPKVREYQSQLNQESDSWLAKVRDLKKRGELQQAFDICVSAYPLKSAFKQSCVIARMMIKEQLNAGRMIDREVAVLYKTAALAAFFYDEKSELVPIPKSRLRRSNRQMWEDIPFKYSEIGFEFLSLLAPNDIKLIISLWGPAETHNRVRSLYAQNWQTLVEKS